MTHIRPPWCFALLGALFLLTAAPAAGQVVFSGGAGWYRPDVEVLPGIEGGPGYDASVRIGVIDRLQLGAGVQYNRHTLGGAGDAYEVVVPFAEARLLLPLGAPRWGLFVAPRAGWVRHSLHVFGRDVEGSGHLVGGLAGATLRVAAAVDAEVALAWYRATVDELDLDPSEFGLRLEDLSADVPGFRIAVTLGTR